MKLLPVLIFLSVMPFCLRGFEQKEYQFSHDVIDVVIPCHKKDFRTLSFAVQGIKTCIPHGRIIIVSGDEPPHNQVIKVMKGRERVRFALQEPLLNHIEWFDELQYPFSKEDVAYEIFKNKEDAEQYIAHPKTRIGWIYQQLLKLYAPFVIPNISSNVLIVDADTIFLKHIMFQDTTGAPLFNVGIEYTIGYFECMERLIPGLKKKFSAYSGICHHMLFQRPVLEDLFAIIEHIHDEPAWKAICHAIDHQELYQSCFSEYELYFNFIFSRSNQPKIRQLKWKDMAFKSFTPENIKGFEYVSCHSWI